MERLAFQKSQVILISHNLSSVSRFYSMKIQVPVLHCKISLFCKHQLFVIILLVVHKSEIIKRGLKSAMYGS